MHPKAGLRPIRHLDRRNIEARQHGLQVMRLQLGRERRVEIADEPLQLVETHKEPNPPAA